MRLIFDIETDGLLEQLTVIHSLCLIDVDTHTRYSCHDQDWEHPDPDVVTLSIDEGLRMLMEADEVIGHNVIKFDIPAIQKVKPWFKLRREQVTDTLLKVRLIFADVRDRDFKQRRKLMAKIGPEACKDYWPPRLIGSQGLEAWGIRLGEWKGDYSKEMKAKGLDPWANWNPDMQTYCDQDVMVNWKLWRVCVKKKYAPRAIIIERDFAWILAEMERNGFPFNRSAAVKLQGKLMRRKAEIDDALAEAFPPITETWDFTPKANNSKLGYVKGKTIQKTKEIVFNPASRDHIARWLKDKYGWKPTRFTDTGKPAIDEKLLKKLPFPEAKLLAEAFLIDKRLGMLEGRGGRGLIPYSVLGEDGVYRIHGSVNTNAAVTRRCTHQSPNMAQLPAITVPFGRQFRELMMAPRGFKLLGWDASGLELRCFAHYMARYDGGAYIATVLEGDIHWVHAKALSGKFDDEEYDEHNEDHAHWRNKVAKRFIYAYLYGAGAETIGEIIIPAGSSAEKKKAGNKLIKQFLKRTPALARLKDDIKAFIAKHGGFVRGIDGGRISVRSEHSALNSLLQSAGAIAVKVATIYFYDKLIAAGLVSGRDFLLVAHVHDEVQVLVREGLEETVGEIAKEAMHDAGEALGFKCPLAADWKAGANWADTH